MTPIQFPMESRRAMAVAGARLKPHIPEFARQCTGLIQKNIAAYAPSASGNRERAIYELAAFAGTQFCALLESRPADPNLRPLARRLAAQAAARGESMETFMTALSYAQELGYRYVDALASAAQALAQARPSLHSAVGRFIAAIAHEVTVGYQHAVTGMRRSPEATRRTLALALFNGAWDERCNTLAKIVQWKVPDRFLVVSVGAHDRQRLNLNAVDPLYIVTGDVITFTCDLDVAEHVRGLLTGAGTTLATFTAVNSIAQVAEGGRETCTLLSLAREGVCAEPTGYLDCREYTQLIWLANAPTQREELTARMLAPLAHHKGEYRERLLETLRLFLLTRHSAPRLAEALHAHPQTVRARMRLLSNALGHIIDDPEESMTLLLLLNSTRTTSTA